ncbi:MAG: Rieske 2Fe-2S domain-containing protein [Dehalococcoidia bacterium]|nr:Rieske 2Fe-2S domain-containing protein [Dehalococcoidia bacterium]
MGFVEVARTTDIPDGEMRSFSIEGKPILISCFEGKYYAIGGRCTHMGGELAKGKLDGKIVSCPRHGARFDVTTGECISGPKIGMIKLKTNNVPAYEVKVEDNSIKVNL